MAYNTPETVADYLARFQMEITHRGKGTFTPDHVKYSLTIASGGKDFFTTFESNPHVHGEPTKKNAPEKDDRDAQPPVDTDNR